MVANQNATDTFFFIRLPHPLLARIDLLSTKMHTSRESTLRVIVCAFAKKHGVEVPPQEASEYPTPPTPRNKYHKYRLEHRVAILIPKEREGSWITQLQQASGETSINQLFRRPINEFDETILA